MRETIYIAGKISGLPYWRTYLKFALRWLMLWVLGYKPVNPMFEIPKKWSYNSQVSWGKYLAMECDHIYLAHNWRRSPGAFRELRAYLRTGKKKIKWF